MRPLLIDPEEVRRRRVAAGLTLPELADQTGLSRGYLSDIENGKKSPSAVTLRVLAPALGCEIEDLMPPRAEAPTEAGAA